MSATKHNTSKVFYPIRILMLFFIDKIISRLGKKVIFITSLYLLSFKKDDGYDKEKEDQLLHSVNQAFDFVEKENVLELPALLADSLWDIDVVSDCINGVCEANIQESVDTLIAAAPKCLRYGRKEDMRKDVIKMFGVIKQQAA